MWCDEVVAFTLQAKSYYFLYIYDYNYIGENLVLGVNSKFLNGLTWMNEA